MKVYRVAFWGLAALAAALTGYIAYLETGEWRNRPYDRGEIRGITRDGDIITFVADFVKFDHCAKESFRVVAITLGEVSPLSWNDLQGRDIDENREAGAQTLAGEIDLNGLEPDRVEIRLRHLCRIDGEDVLVTTVFAAIDPQRLIEIK